MLVAAVEGSRWVIEPMSAFFARCFVAANSVSLSAHCVRSLLFDLLHIAIPLTDHNSMMYVLNIALAPETL